MSFLNKVHQSSLCKSSLFAVLLILSGFAVAECNLPSAPIIPDGNVASEDELVAAQGSLKEFQANLNDYRTCLAEKQQKLSEGVDPDEKSAVMIAEEEAMVAAYNDSVTAEEEAAAEFNTAVRAFKARQN